MADGEARGGGMSSSVGCEHCNSEAAILYCRADSAKLCAMCDQHVHSANPLSLKHIRSQICHNCHSQPVSFLCLSDNLLLCQDCDSDAHSSTLHNRVPVEGFTGCPSPSQLASHLGLHHFTKLLQQNTSHYQYDDEDGDADDQFMVPNTMFPQVFTKGLPQSSAGANSSTCWKQKHIILKQLIHLSHTQQQQKQFQIQEEEDARPRGKRRSMSTVHDDDNDPNSLLLTQYLTPHQQQLPFTSLLMQQVSTSNSTSHLDVMNEVQQAGFEQGGQMLWTTRPSD